MKPLILSFLTAALAEVTVATAEVARRYQTGDQWIAVVLLAVLLLLAVCAAAAGVSAAVFCAVTEWRRRHLADAYTPPDGPLWPYGKPDPATTARDVRVISECADVYAEVARHAWHETAQPARDGLTQAMPVVEAGLWRPTVGGGGR